MMFFNCVISQEEAKDKNSSNLFGDASVIDYSEQKREIKRKFAQKYIFFLASKIFLARRLCCLFQSRNPSSC